MPEVMLKVKFNIGDAVYRIKCDKGMNDLGIICPVCDGTGKFKSPTSGQVYDCPGVNGYLCKNGKMNVVWRNCYYPVKDKTTFICVERHQGIDKVSYGMESGMDIYEQELYATPEEAQAVCDQKNGISSPSPIMNGETNDD